MANSALTSPDSDPSLVFELFRGSYGSELLTAAVAHFNLFARLARQPLSFDQLRVELELAERPAVVLITALRAMTLIAQDPNGKLTLTPLSKGHLVPGAAFDVSDYIGLASTSPGVLEMVARLKSNQPAGLDEAGSGAAFIYRDGLPSAMEESELARHFTLALAGRAKNVAPVLANKIDLSGVGTILDVAGGTGIYSIALLQQNPKLRAIVLDRPEVLRIAAEFAEQYRVQDRIELVEGDMFSDLPWPETDAILLSNVLHDWDVPECQGLISRCASTLRRGKKLLIHDVFLNDEMDGPLPIALYSAALFTLTEGRAYAAAEYRKWMEEAGFEPEGSVPTLIHCGVLTGVKRR